LATIEQITGSEKVKDSYQKIYNSDNAINTELETHIASVTAHEAEKIVFSPITNVTSTDVQGAVTQVSARVSNIIASSGTSDTEVVDARNSTVKGETFTVLDDRLETTEQDFETLNTEVVDARNSTVKGETFTVLDGRLEATEQDLKTLSIDIIDTDNTLNYETIIKVVSGKPVLEYEEVL